MSTVRVHAGMELHNMSPDEFRGIVREENAIMRAQMRGVKHAYFPRAFQGVMTGTGTTLGEAFQLGPENGQCWGVTRLVVNGLTAGTTPDIVDIFFDDSFSQRQWQVNGNNFGYTFNPREFLMSNGHILMLRANGTIAATGAISLAGEYWIMPAETAGRLIGH